MKKNAIEQFKLAIEWGVVVVIAPTLKQGRAGGVDRTRERVVPLKTN